ncbi:MAG: transaldolase family protein [Gemmatales bacterium]|nr:transaldolase [Gemmatales bacterium]MDW7994894.1 transaldolase family protein [Gemmatales bacterium]
MTPLDSLRACGSKIWLDSVDPRELERNLAWGITGATSNPVIIAEIIQSGQCDRELQDLLQKGDEGETVAWQLTDYLVAQAEQKFLPVWEKTGGEDGYVSFELDPLLEVSDSPLDLDARARRYVQEAVRWQLGHRNRLIKVPATPAGIKALPEMVAQGVRVNVTLIFTARQYQQARDAIWQGAQRLSDLRLFKSVYSIFVSRLDVYADKYLSHLPEEVRGQLGILNAKRIWQMNQQYWRERPTPLHQEIVFASTGTKRPGEKPWKYLEAFAGGDILTNPPATNLQTQESGICFRRQIEQLPPDDVVSLLDRHVDYEHLEATLLREGIEKFVQPQRQLLDLINRRRLGISCVTKP